MASVVGLVPSLLAGSIPLAVLSVVMPFAVTRIMASQKKIRINSDGIMLGRKLYPIEQIERVETYQNNFGGQGRCHIVIRLKNGKTVPWRWVSYMRSSFGILMQEDYLSPLTKRYLTRMTKSLDELGIPHSIVGVSIPVVPKRLY